VTAAIPPTGVWWHVYPLGFLSAEPSARPECAPIEHRLELLDPWLDYAVALGVEGLVLGPVFASEALGYDTPDHFRVDPRLGDEDDLVRLISGAHQRGLRVADGRRVRRPDRVLARGLRGCAAGIRRHRCPAR